MQIWLMMDMFTKLKKKHSLLFYLLLSPSLSLRPLPYSIRLDVCETRIEIVTPYWASNSAGKIRAIVNTQHFEQAIHQELCTYVSLYYYYFETILCCLRTGVIKFF